MNVHKNARLAPLGRAVMITRIEQEGWPVARAAEASGVSRRTAYRWLARSTVGAVSRRIALGKLAALDPKPPVIGYERERPGELIHLDIKKLGRFSRPGHRVTGRGPGSHSGGGQGWDYLHVCVDDASRLAYTEILQSETQHDASAFLERALAWLARHGVKTERVMTDNGAGYRSKRFTAAVQRAGARHIFTRPYTPRTNGKAERFIPSSLRQWA